MNRSALILLLCSQVVLLLLLWQQLGPEEKTSSPAPLAEVSQKPEEKPLPDSWVEKKLPRATLVSPSGKTNLRDVRGPAVVEFISTSCPYCQKMAPVFNREMRKTRVSFLVVGVGSETLGSMRRWHERRLGQKMPGTFAVDSKGEAVSALGLVGTPTTIFVGRNGLVRTFITGEFSGAELRQLLRDTLR